MKDRPIKILNGNRLMAIVTSVLTAGRKPRWSTTPAKASASIS